MSNPKDDNAEYWLDCALMDIYNAIERIEQGDNNKENYSLAFEVHNAAKSLMIILDEQGEREGQK